MLVGPIREFVTPTSVSGGLAFRNRAQFREFAFAVSQDSRDDAEEDTRAARARRRECPRFADVSRRSFHGTVCYRVEQEFARLQTVAHGPRGRRSKFFFTDRAFLDVGGDLRGAPERPSRRLRGPGRGRLRENQLSCIPRAQPRYSAHRVRLGPTSAVPRRARTARSGCRPSWRGTRSRRARTRHGGSDDRTGDRSRRASRRRR